MQQRRTSDDGKQCGNAGRVKNLGAKEKARRKKCKVRSSLIKKNKAFQKSFMRVGVKKLLRAGVVPARTWGVHAVGMVPTEIFISRRQMAAAAGKKSTTSLSLFMEVFGLEVEEDISALAAQHWAEGVDWKVAVEQKEAWINQALEVQTSSLSGDVRNQRFGRQVAALAHPDI